MVVLVLCVIVTVKIQKCESSGRSVCSSLQNWFGFAHFQFPTLFKIPLGVFAVE